MFSFSRYWTTAVSVDCHATTIPEALADPVVLNNLNDDGASVGHPGTSDQALLIVLASPSQ
jgi:hypothetical protein